MSIIMNQNNLIRHEFWVCSENMSMNTFQIILARKESAKPPEFTACPSEQTMTPNLKDTMQTPMVENPKATNIFGKETMSQSYDRAEPTAV